MSPKVLFTASTYSHIRNFHLPYLRGFREHGWEVHIACAGAPEHCPEADRAVSLPFEKKMQAPGNLRAARLLHALMRDEGYTLLCTHTSLAAFFSRLALSGLKSRPRVVNMVHGYLFDDETSALKRNLLLAAERWMAPRTDLLLTMNDWDEALAQRYRLGRSLGRVPGVGVDFARLDRGADPSLSREALRRALDLPEEAFLLVYGAEFSQRKSQPVLLRALTHLPEQVCLVLSGTGATMADCRALAEELGLRERVFFPGQVEMGPYYRAADAAVSASRSEGLPFNVMEAMHCALPVVASNVKGHSDLIEHGRTGLLYAYGDEGACAEAIRLLLEDAALRERLGRQAAEEAARYALERVYPAVFAQYERVLPQVAVP